jgi:hypothetical protein
LDAALLWKLLLGIFLSVVGTEVPHVIKGCFEENPRLDVPQFGNNFVRGQISWMFKLKLAP